MLGFRRRQQIHSFDEGEAYHRCHGDRHRDVRIVHIEPRRPRYEAVQVKGEELRQAFEQRLDAREPTAPVV